MVLTETYITVLRLLVQMKLLYCVVQGEESIVLCDLEPSLEKGTSYYRRLTPWGKWLEMPCPPKTVFIVKWCRCDYPEMEEILTKSTKGILKVTTPEKTTLNRQPQPTEASYTTGRETTPSKTSVSTTSATTTTTITTTTTSPSTSAKPTTHSREILSKSTKPRTTSSFNVSSTTLKPLVTESTMQFNNKGNVSTTTMIPTRSNNDTTIHNHEDHTLRSTTVSRSEESAVLSTVGNNVKNFTLSLNATLNPLVSTPNPVSGEHSNINSSQTTPHGHIQTSSTNNNETTNITKTPTEAPTAARQETTKSSTVMKTATASPPTNPSLTVSTCEYQEVADDKFSYMGYINADIGWIRFQCPHHQQFSQARCGCFNPMEISAIKTTTEATTTIGIPKGCPYVKEGRKAFREFIDVLKTWVFSECGESYEFSQLKCGCVLEGTSPDGDHDNFIKTTSAPVSTAPVLTSTEEVPPGCPYIAVGKSSFREYVSNIQSWVYSDCAPEHVFKQAACRCEPETIVINGCPFIAVDKSSFKEYIDVLGEWVTSDCPNGFSYSPSLCKCVQQDCKHEAVGLTSFRTYIEEIKDWVISDCPKSHIYSPSLCKCVSEGGEGTAVHIPDHVEKHVTTTPLPVSTESISMVTTADCPAVAKIGGYRRYIEAVDSWVDYDCPIHTEFNIRTCSCQKAGCKYVPDQTGYKEFVDLLGTWIFYDCPVGTSFQTDSCKCDKENTKGRLTTLRPTLPDHHDGQHPGDSGNSTSNCLKVQKNNGYMEFLASLGDWVYYDCPVEQVFSDIDCACVYNGKNSNKDGGKTGCAFSSTGGGTYRQFVDEISQWVSYDCPVGQQFDNQLCKCAGKDATSDGSNIFPTSIQTTASPCSMKASDMGEDYFLLFVEGHGDILYQCDFGFVFNQTQCECVKEATKPTTPKSTYITPGCPLMPSPLGEGYFRMQIGIMGMIDFACPKSQKYDYGKCMCTF